MFFVFELNTEHSERIAELMRKYADLPMDLADASLVVLAQYLAIILLTSYKEVAMPEQTLIEQLAAVLNVEVVSPMDGNEAQSLHKALPGYQAVADDAARFVQKYGETPCHPSLLLKSRQSSIEERRKSG